MRKGATPLLAPCHIEVCGDKHGNGVALYYSILTQCCRQSLMQFLEDQPTAYVDEMQQYIFESFDIDIATQSIGRHLRLARWSRKVVKARAAEQSLSLRIAC
jgi:hypothetical protein